ncbi:carboxypeptidase-like regulatory domain-containing protein [Hymenobacter rigui]|uniref:Carboxypeptidase regulatory-like domain-containing protein n=1 Tax=Hymenobacter rigui TaxID=334424 RepID=A0A428K9M4_9BACT|nr:carboxypeptidase-like regulatory domain-containing protein [Hymenobacter rigui]RSK43199.1 carboxypeptidase regulatory-like domain-containing protein [Hymenobacter rigui]
MKELLILIISLLCSLPLPAQTNKVVCQKYRGAHSRILVLEKKGTVDSILALVSGRIVSLSSAKKAYKSDMVAKQWVIEARNTATNSTQRITTNELGDYNLWLREGSYRFTVSGIGFPATTFKLITVSKGTLWQVDLGIGTGKVWIRE